ISINAIHDSEGSLIGFAKVTRDISDRKRAEEEAVALSKLKSMLLATASHEFRTPLNLILGFTEVIGEHLVEIGDGTQQRYIDSIQRAGNGLLRTVNRILDFSKLEAGGLELNPRPCRLARFAQQEIDRFQDVAA